LPSLVKVYDECTFRIPVDAPVLKRVDGDLFIASKSSAPKLEIVNGDVTLKGIVHVPNLRLVGGNLYSYSGALLYGLR